MPKYKNIICWVSPDEKKCLNEINQKFNVPIIFAKNYDEFITLIELNSYPVFSLKKGNTCCAKLQNVVRKFPKVIFQALARLDHKGLTPMESDILFEETNVIHLSYDVDEIFKEFIGEFISLYEKRGIHTGSTNSE